MWERLGPWEWLSSKALFYPEGLRSSECQNTSPQGTQQPSRREVKHPGIFLADSVTQCTVCVPCWANYRLKMLLVKASAFIMDPGALGHCGFLLMLFEKPILFRFLCVFVSLKGHPITVFMGSCPPSSPCPPFPDPPPPVPHPVPLSRDLPEQKLQGGEEELRLLVEEMLSAMRVRQMEEK